MTNGGLLTAEQILAADDLKTDYVEVPEWGGTVKVRALGNVERKNIALEMSRLGNDVSDSLKFTAVAHLIVSSGCIDEAGNRVFSEEQVEKVGERGTAPLQRVAARIVALSGITKEGAEEVVGESGAEAVPATS